MAKSETKVQKIKKQCKEHTVCCGYSGRIVELYTMDEALEKIDEYLDEFAEEYVSGERNINDLDYDGELDEIQTEIETEFTFFNCCPECGWELNKWWVRGCLRKRISGKLEYFKFNCEKKLNENLSQALDEEYQRRLTE